MWPTHLFPAARMHFSTNFHDFCFVFPTKTCSAKQHHATHYLPLENSIRLVDHISSVASSVTTACVALHLTLKISEGNKMRCSPEFSKYSASIPCFCSILLPSAVVSSKSRDINKYIRVPQQPPERVLIGGIRRRKIAAMRTRSRGNRVN